MVDVSFAELALIMIIALIILGPERLPSAARTLGHWMGRARAAFNHLKYELESEAINQEMREKFKNQLEDMGLDEKSLSGETTQNPQSLEDRSKQTPDTTQPASNTSKDQPGDNDSKS